MPSVPVHGGPPVAGEVHRVQQPDLRPGREVQAGGRSIQEGEDTVLCSTMSVQLPWQCLLDLFASALYSVVLSVYCHYIFVCEADLYFLMLLVSHVYKC